MSYFLWDLMAHTEWQLLTFYNDFKYDCSGISNLNLLLRKLYTSISMYRLLIWFECCVYCTGLIAFSVNMEMATY